MSTYLNFYIAKDKEDTDLGTLEKADYSKVVHIFGLQTSNDIIGAIYDNIGYFGEDDRFIKLTRPILDNVEDTINNWISVVKKRIEALELVMRDLRPTDGDRTSLQFAYELIEARENLLEYYELLGQLRIFYWMLESDSIYIVIT